MTKPLTFETWADADSDSLYGCCVVRESTGEVLHTTSGHSGRRAAAAAAREWARGWFAAELLGDRLVISDAAGEKVYAVTALESDFGDCYRLNAAAGFALAAGAESYDVCLDGARSTCECAGFCRHGHCRHLKALEAVTRPAPPAAHNAACESHRGGDCDCYPVAVA